MTPTEMCARNLGIRSALGVILEMFGAKSTEAEKAKALKNINKQLQGVRVYRNLPGSPYGVVVFMDEGQDFGKLPTSLAYCAVYVELALPKGKAQVVKSRYTSPGVILARGSEYIYQAAALSKALDAKLHARKRVRKGRR